MVSLSSQRHSSLDSPEESLLRAWVSLVWLAEWCTCLSASQPAPCPAFMCSLPEAVNKDNLQWPLISPTPQTKAVRSDILYTVCNETQDSFQPGIWFCKGTAFIPQSCSQHEQKPSQTRVYVLSSVESKADLCHPPSLHPVHAFLLWIISGCLTSRLRGFWNLCAHINLYIVCMCTTYRDSREERFPPFPSHSFLLVSLVVCYFHLLPCLKLNHKPVLTGDAFYCGLLGGVLKRN